MSLAEMIDHTALKPDTTRTQIETLCKEAKAYGFASVCVNPTWVSFAKELLDGTSVKVCTVIGFPLGANPKEVKAFETNLTIEQGAGEVDMVINIGALKSGDLETVEADVLAVVAASNRRAIVKVIIETCLLSDDEKVEACRIAKRAGADFVKTSTGFSSGGATVADVALMRRTVGSEMGVKASGGIRSLQDAQNVIEAGATRIGASSGVTILQGLKSTGDY
ncbi:deoxyribose-phosphate aldolase [Bacillus fonticola]|uniref:deoxyribose-phosphate aldolase n=1 Tax=Bacillus fonticola TaxID=2728853 RepID=UPI001473BC83